MTQKTASQKKKTKKKAGAPGFVARHPLGVLIACIATVVVGIAAAFIFFRPAPVDSPRWITVPRNATRQALRDTLELNLGHGYGSVVYTLWRLQGGDPSTAHGAYRVEPRQGALSLSRRLARGRQTPVSLTFNNIRTIDQLAERIASRLEINPDSLIKALNDSLVPRGYTPATFAAAMLPDTYSVYWTTGAGPLVAKLLKHRDRFWDSSRLSRAAALGLSPVEVATIASIVEEETAVAAERGTIARLYINRLHRGMKLQADPTVKFAIGDFSIRRITGPMLSTPSPFNTYLHAGLPPGPIRIPEGATIDSVLRAPAHNYLYMCAKEDFSGRHNFATDYSTHQANARRYRAELNRRNIH